MKIYSDAELAQILDKDIFHLIGEAADELQVDCYVVGGYVRDIFLERPSNDIDVVVVGSGIKVADALRRKLGRKAHISVFKNFGTAQVKYKNLEVEFVGARKESYSHNSRKPIVEDGTLEDDQNRRDFTINAMAIQLNKGHFGELVDPFGGIKTPSTTPKTSYKGRKAEGITYPEFAMHTDTEQLAYNLDKFRQST